MSTEGRIILRREVVQLLHSFRQVEPRQPESGGILLGEVRAQDFIVTRASVPNSRDSARRRSFRRDAHAAQLIVEHEFVNSGGQMTYLGEWHTHPQAVPTPSTVDLRMIEEQFIGDDIHVDSILLVIVGIEQDFVARYNGQHIEQVEVECY